MRVRTQITDLSAAFQNGVNGIVASAAARAWPLEQSSQPTRIPYRLFFSLDRPGPRGQASRHPLLVQRLLQPPAAKGAAEGAFRETLTCRGTCFGRLVAPLPDRGRGATYISWIPYQPDKALISQVGLPGEAC
jgi:hypothetical protein